MRVGVMHEEGSVYFILSDFPFGYLQLSISILGSPLSNCTVIFFYFIRNFYIHNACTYLFYL